MDDVLSILPIEDEAIKIQFIPEENRERVFERFVRLAGTLGSGAGVGLDLALVKWAMEVHHRNFHVPPGPAGGSEFIVFLPISPERAQISS